jgi:DNA-binding CsgD family transcriptional regulator
LPDSLEPLDYWSAGWESLTARELEIVDRVAAGRRNAEIARELQLTTGTVANVLGSIYRKLGVRNRAGLIRALRDHRP